MNGPIEFTREQLLQMCRSYRAGKSLNDLSQEYGISITAVTSRLKANGVKIRPRGAPAGGRSSKAKELVLRLLSAGKTIQEIADDLSVTVRTIYRRLES